MMASSEKSAGCRSLNVANIDPRVDEQVLTQIMSHVGRVVSIRIIKDINLMHGGLSSAYVEYEDHQTADSAMATLNGQQIYDYCISLTWAISQTNKKEDTTGHFHIWVGDVAADVDDNMLMQAFSSSKFPSVSDGRVLWDPNTGKSRGYGFVSFREKADAEKALSTMNGIQLGSKRIRCNWAHQRNNLGGNTAGANVNGGGGVVGHSSSGGAGSYSSAAAFIPPTRPSLNYNYVFSQSSPMYTTIYVGNVPPNATIEMLQPLFAPYGYVADIKVSPERGFAFVKMDTHENATQAICWLNGVILNGQKLKCAWGRDRSTEASAAYVGGTAAAPNAQYYGYGYGAPQQAQGQAGAANSAAATATGYPAGYEQYYNQYNQYYAQYYAQAAGYDPNTGQPYMQYQQPPQQQQQQQDGTQSSEQQ